MQCTHIQQCGHSQGESGGGGQWKWANVEEIGTERDYFRQRAHNAVYR